MTDLIYDSIRSIIQGKIDEIGEICDYTKRIDVLYDFWESTDLPCVVINIEAIDKLIISGSISIYLLVNERGSVQYFNRLKKLRGVINPLIPYEGHNVHSARINIIKESKQVGTIVCFNHEVKNRGRIATRPDEIVETHSLNFNANFF
jgi:hypothetical protein